MIWFACPGCGLSLVLPHEMAGTASVCSRCGRTFTVPDPSVTVPAPGDGAPAAAPGRRARLLGALAWLGLLTILVSLGGGLFLLLGDRPLLFWLNPDVRVYVDNTTGGPVTVAVEGAGPVVVPAGQVGEVACRPGRRRVSVRGGRGVLLDAVADLGGPAGRSGQILYVLDPTGSRQYVSYTVSSSPRGGLSGGREGVPPGPRTEGRLREEFQDLQAHLRLLPAGHWHRVDDHDFILTPVPKAARHPPGHGRREQRGFTRLAEGDARSLGRLLAVQRPTAGDLVELSGLWEKVLETDPRAGR